MNLVTRFLAQRRDRLLMRLGCWLVCFSLILGLMLPQQRAEALVAELSMTAVASVAAAYLGACGLNFITQGMDKDALVSSIQRLINEFLDTELGGMSIQDWLGNIWDLTVMAGKLILGRPLTNEFVGFAQWVAQKYGAQVGENVIYSDYGIVLKDGSIMNLSTFDNPSNLDFSESAVISYDFKLGTRIPVGTSSSDYSELVFTDDYIVRFYANSISIYFQTVVNGKVSSWIKTSYSKDDFLTFALSLRPENLGALTYFCYYATGYEFGPVLTSWSGARTIFDVSITEKLLSGTDLSIDRAPSMSYIPEGIAAEQGIALDVGAATTMDLDLVLQGVLDDVLAGTLTSTMEGAKGEVVDSPAEEIPDVDDLGLPALGAALTSRFPFSIPWDFFRAVQLLAAPAKAPYFEVDFLKPIEHRVGKWQGSTTVVLDFSQYAILGQLSRWTSTIGFCLMLATATKRLIWTA